MPFRRWFAERGASHPTAYSMLTLAGGMLACMIIAVLISVQASNRAVQQNIQQERRAQQESQRLYCSQIIIIRNEYREQADTLSPAGRKIGEAWDYLATTFCE